MRCGGIYSVGESNVYFVYIINVFLSLSFDYNGLMCISSVELVIVLIMIFSIIGYSCFSRCVVVGLVSSC